MALSVNTNLASLNAASNLNRSNKNLQRTLGRISSGLRINRGADDAAGLAVSENLDADRRSLMVAKRNTNDGISVIQTAEGATSEVANLLKRMRELAVQASSDTLANSERAYLDAEATTATAEIARIAATTEFNGVNLSDGVVTQLDVQVGINATDQITVGLADLTTTTLGIGGVDLSTAANARTALTTLDTAINTVSGSRAGFGASQNRLESVMNNIEVYSESLAAAQSRIKDADFAQESADLAKHQIMQQAGIAVLAQASSMHEGVMRLLG